MSENLNNIYLDHNFYEDGLDTTITVRLLACYSKFKKCKVLKKR